MQSIKTFASASDNIIHKAYLITLKQPSLKLKNEFTYYILLALVWLKYATHHNPISIIQLINIPKTSFRTIKSKKTEKRFHTQKSVANNT